MSRIARLLKSARPETRRHFTNGCEMAGYYAAHMVDELNRFGFAPDQLGVLNLGDTPFVMRDYAVLLDVFTQSGDTFASLPDLALSVVRVSTASANTARETSLLLSIYESSGFQLDAICPLKKTCAGFELDEPEIIDIAGVDLDLRAVVKLDCLLDITQGMNLYAAFTHAGA